MALGVRKILSAFGVTVVLGLASAPSADAALILAGRVTNGSSTDVCSVDNNLSVCTWGTQILDDNPAIGALGFGTAVPVNIGGLLFTTNLNTAEVGPPFNILTSSSTTIRNPTSVTLNAQFAVSSTDFLGPVDGAESTGSGTWINANGSVIHLDYYNDAGNNQGAETPTDTPGILVSSFTDTAVGTTDSFAFNSGLVPVVDPGLFSMTLYYAFDLKPRAQLLARGMAEVKPNTVPEAGSTMAFFGLGLIGVGMLRRRILI
jgi:hypothetical protein